MSRLTHTDDHHRRIHEHGAPVLTDAELLALLLKRGGQVADTDLALAREILAEHGGWVGLLHVDATHLARRAGIGQATVSVVKATLEIARRLVSATPVARLQIRSPVDIAQVLLLQLGNLDQEHLVTVCLDTKNRVQKIQTVYIGSVNTAVIRVGEVFKEAIRLNSAALIVAHNHPSGEPSPSAEDVQITRQIVEAGKLLDVDVLDHLIIGAGRFVSLRERGLGFKS